MSIKNQSQPESRELLYLVRMLRTLSLGDSISVAPRHCSKEVEEAVMLYISFQQRGEEV